jgi:hypothetical protein
MIQVEHILDEEAVLVERGDEQLIDPSANALAHRDRLAWRRGALSCHHHASGRQPPSNNSMTSPVFILVTLAVGG